MKKNLTALAPYVIVLGIDFYLLPFGANSTGMAMLFMLCVMPVIALAAAVAYGLCHGFSIILSGIAFFLFIPAVFVHYNSSAWIYSVVYAIIVLAGTAIGAAFYKKK